eukprot:762875-Hanusia_phi.AAC.5
MLSWEGARAVSAKMPEKLRVVAKSHTNEVDRDVHGRLQVKAYKHLVYDDFEDGSFGSWEVSPRRCPTEVTVTVASKDKAQGKQGNRRCMTIRGGLGHATIDNNWKKCMCRRFSPIRPTYFSFYCKTNKVDAETGTLFMKNSNGNVLALFLMGAGGKFGIDSTLLPEPFSALHFTAEVNRWYHVRFNIDWGEHKYDLLIDNQVLSCGIPFESDNVENLEWLYVANSSLESVTSWDAFELADGIEVPELTLHHEPYMRHGMAEVEFSFQTPAKGIFLHAELAEPGEHECGQKRKSCENASKVEGASKVFDVSILEYDAIKDANSVQLQSDFLRLADDPTMSDFTLIVEGQKLHVHKVVLYARCPHLRSMFTSGMLECEKKELVLEDVPLVHFRKVCQFIYTGSVFVDQHDALEVLMLADRFLLHGLKLQCSAILTSSISTENVILILKYADKFDAPDLKVLIPLCTVLAQVSWMQARCIQFITQRFGEIVKSAEYRSLESRLMMYDNLILEQFQELLTVPEQRRAGGDCSACQTCPGSLH